MASTTFSRQQHNSSPEQILNVRVIYILMQIRALSQPHTVLWLILSNRLNLWININISLGFDIHTDSMLASPAHHIQSEAAHQQRKLSFYKIQMRQLGNNPRI
ncbi:hypothetical protein PAMP_003559 [Pampus punctatissimus]